MPKRLDASKKEAYDLAVLKFVVEDGRPFETAAGVGFQNLCAVFTDGAYKPPHPTTLLRLAWYIRPIRFENSIRNPTDSRFDSNAKNTIRKSLSLTAITSCNMPLSESLPNQYSVL